MWFAACGLWRLRVVGWLALIAFCLVYGFDVDIVHFRSFLGFGFLWGWAMHLAGVALGGLARECFADGDCGLVGC